MHGSRKAPRSGLPLTLWVVFAGCGGGGAVAGSDPPGAGGPGAEEPAAEAGAAEEGAAEEGVAADPLQDTVAPEPPPALVLVDARELAGRAERPMTVSLFEGDPRSVGMDPAALQALDSVVLAAVADGVTPGAALAVGRRGRLVRLRGYGTLDWPAGSEADAAPDRAAPLAAAAFRLVTPATIYDLASLTKVVGTTTAVMILDERGEIELDAPVVRYLPWWSGGHADKETVTVRQLLLHRGGLPAFRRWFFEIEGREAYRQAVADEPLERPPGEATVYSDLGAMTLAWIVEAVAGESLDAFLEREVFGSLGMDDTGFLPDPVLRARTAPTEVDTIWRDVHVHGVVHDENADAAGGVAGHAGLFSTAWDLSVFARMMLAGGMARPCEPDAGSGVTCSASRADTLRLLQPRTIRRYTTRYDETSGRALGWDTPEGRSSAGDYFTTSAFGHTGFTGTSIWMDPELDLFVVLLTNRVNPTRANTAHVPFRREVHDRAARAIMDRPVPPRGVGEGRGGAPAPEGR